LTSLNFFFWAPSCKSPRFLYCFIILSFFIIISYFRNYFGWLWSSPKNSSLPDQPAIAAGNEELEQKLQDKPVVPPTEKNNGNKTQIPSAAEKELKKPIVEPSKPIVKPEIPPLTPITTPPVTKPVASPVPTPPVPKTPVSPAVNGHHGNNVPDNKPVESKPKDVETKPKVPETPSNDFGTLQPKPKTNVTNNKPKVRDATTDFLAMEQGLARYLI
jgi:hypothetical protein